MAKPHFSAALAELYQQGIVIESDTNQPVYTTGGGCLLGAKQAQDNT
jgi:hypothetical protein